MTGGKTPCVVQYCSSLFEPCGIASYTKLFASAQKMKAVSHLGALEDENCSHLHVQHEFGIMDLPELKRIRAFCTARGIALYVTMHTVIPQPNLLQFLLYRYLRIGRWRARHVPGLWKWTEEMPEYGLRAYLQYRRTQQFFVRHADTIIVHGEEAAHALERMGANTVEVVPHGIQKFPVSASLLSASDGKFHVGCFGHLHPDRGLFDIIAACSQIPNVHLHIHASAQMTDAHSTYLAHLQSVVDSEDWITLDTTHVALDYAVHCLSQYDVNVWYCNPPGGISASGSVCQYIAAKRPIIASDTVMVVDLGDAVTRVPPRSPEALAEALSIYSTDTTRLHDLCEERSWKVLRPHYEGEKLYPSFRSHFLYWNSKEDQQREQEESVQTLRDICTKETELPLACDELTELHPAFLHDPLLAYNHQYANGNPACLPSEKTILFLHLQKTGGTTLAHIIRSNVRSVGLRLDFSSQPNINPAYLLDAFQSLSPHRKEEEREKWSAYDVLSNHFGFGIHHLIKGPFAYITMLRDPVARLLSYYRTLKQQPEVSWIGSPTYAERACQLSLREWMEDPFFRQAIVLGHSSTQMLAGTRDSELTAYHLHRAKRNLLSFEAVLLTEKFEKSLEILHALYGWKPEIFDGQCTTAWTGQRLGRITDGESARQECAPEDIRAIEELLHYDMELYDYAKQLFHKQYAMHVEKKNQLTSASTQVTLRDVSRKVDVPAPQPSLLRRIFTYLHLVIRIPTNLAHIAEYSGQMHDIQKVQHVQNTAFQKMLRVLIARQTARLETIISRLEHMSPRWDVHMDRLQDITTQTNGIAYNTNEIIASLEAIADLTAAQGSKSALQQKLEEAKAASR